MEDLVMVGIAVIVFALCASVVTAHAECAWVLWREQPIFSEQWKLAESRVAVVFAAEVECQRWAEANLTADEGKSEAALKRGEKGAPYARYLCLPDTVDPRAPKGK